MPVARLLLDHGADPDTGYLWEGTYPFTALTGAFGGGEDRGNQPPHSQGLALARMLLEGAPTRTTARPCTTASSSPTTRTYGC